MTCKKDIRAAALKGDIKCLKELLKRGEDPNKRYEHNMTVLHHLAMTCSVIDAFIGNCVDVARVLLENGADPNARDEWGQTPLHLAAYDGHRDLVRLLLEYGADPNALDIYNATPLHAAVSHDHPGAVEDLLKGGADPTIRDKYGRTPLDLARMLGRHDIVYIITSYTPQRAAGRGKRRHSRKAKQAA
jgi:cytohesin